ncbi:hypothetical protein Tco_0950681 [Tanacetum coccineum]
MQFLGSPYKTRESICVIGIPEEIQEDEGDMNDGCDITVEDVERLRKILTPSIHTLPNLEPIEQPYMPLGLGPIKLLAKDKVFGHEMHKVEESKVIVLLDILIAFIDPHVFGRIRVLRSYYPGYKTNQVELGIGNVGSQRNCNHIIGSEMVRDSYGNGDYDEDPYDDDMYEGQDLPQVIQAICDNLDIRVRGRKKK